MTLWHSHIKHVCSCSSQESCVLPFRAQNSTIVHTHFAGSVCFSSFEFNSLSPQVSGPELWHRNALRNLEAKMCPGLSQQCSGSRDHLLCNSVSSVRTKRDAKTEAANSSDKEGNNLIWNFKGGMKRQENTEEISCFHAGSTALYKWINLTKLNFL